MHSKLTLSYVLGFAWIIHAPHILARPLMPRQATVTLLVLNDSVDKKLGCSAAQIATLRSALTGADSLCTTAVNTLFDTAQAGTTPEAVTTFLGISDEELEDETQLRLGEVGDFFGGSLTEITNLTDQNSATTVTFYCPADSTTAEDGNPCDPGDYAATTNLQDGEGEINKIALCDLFFSGATLASDTATHNADKAAGKLTSFTVPQEPALTLIHEAQHSIPLLGGDDSDTLLDIATTVAECAALDGDEKSDNAENWALIAFLATVDPSRFTTTS